MAEQSALQQNQRKQAWKRGILKLLGALAVMVLSACLINASYGGDAAYTGLCYGFFSALICAALYDAMYEVRHAILLGPLGFAFAALVAFFLIGVWIPNILTMFSIMVGTVLATLIIRCLAFFQE
jgi:hypothetical protein